ncbi:MAG: M50 family metallopeptidase [Oscillospiraceae bacterium]|nr:M50 family metallopeptidase [Oscillospiraceae bacterium]
MKKLGKILYGMTMLAGGFLFGVYIIPFLRAHSSPQEIALTLIALVAFYQLHILLHETGHLIAGKRSGYTFISFRVYNFMLIRQNGRLVRKKFSVVGTAGQCLMSPPEMKDGKFPVLLYNLGGSLMNFLVSAVCFGLFWTLPTPWSVPFLVGAILGVFMGLFNLIPLKLNGVANDGYNALLLKRKGNEIAQRALWTGLRAYAAQASGTRARDLPPEWFEWVDLNNITDPILASVAILRYNYLCDKGDLDEARAFISTLLESNAKLLEVQKNELRCELLFYELIRECREEEINRLYTKELQDYIQATSIYPSRQRLLYAHARLAKHDPTLAAKYLALFQTAIQKSAVLGEIPGEEELVALVDTIAEQRQ